MWRWRSMIGFARRKMKGISGARQSRNLTQRNPRVEPMALRRKSQSEIWFHILDLRQLGFCFWCCLALALGTVAQEKAKPSPEAKPSDSPEQAFQSAQTFQVAGDFEKAAAAYREAIAGALQHLGNLRISHKEYAEGVELLSRAVKVDPMRVAIRVDLAIGHFASSDLEKAKSEVEASRSEEH